MAGTTCARWALPCQSDVVQLVKTWLGAGLVSVPSALTVTHPCFDRQVGWSRCGGAAAVCCSCVCDGAIGG
jgi:hypothetical protein